MLDAKEKQRLSDIITALKSTGGEEIRGHDQNRRFFKLQRDILHLWEDYILRCQRNGLNPGGEDDKSLRRLAGDAVDTLGGLPEPCPISLKHYDHLRYGPFLGISDEGSAAGAIRKAALNSPKSRALSQTEPIQVGVSLDAERLAAVGEVAVGPVEYREIKLECMGRILNTTNVGTRLNLRYFKRRPIIMIPGGPVQEAVKTASRAAGAALRPFLNTPDRIPRPITIFAQFKTSRTMQNRREILNALNNNFGKGRFCNPDCHKLGHMVTVPRGKTGVVRVKDAIDLAVEAGLAEVAVNSRLRKKTEDKISMPGILNYFHPRHAREILQHAEKKKITVSPRNLVDTDTVARNVWAGLSTARRMGFECGKYGLFPLTLEENDKVTGMVQSWFADWTAAPAFYIDFPTVDKADVYEETEVRKALKKFLHILSKHDIPVVLIDTADKDKQRRILKSGENDNRGILNLRQIAELDAYARDLGIKTLWAGGITLDQAYLFGKLKVFGIYVTSAASVSKPVSKAYASDSMLTAEKEPTLQGASRAKLLLEAGFLVTSLVESGNRKTSAEIERLTEAWIEQFRSDPSGEPMRESERALRLLLDRGWRTHFDKFNA